jgi:hypothetical protein
VFVFVGLTAKIEKLFLLSAYDLRKKLSRHVIPALACAGAWDL